MVETSREHASQIIGLIDRVLLESSVTKEKLDGIAVADGPGSFTGLRIGMAAAKGMAVALGKPLVGVSTFEVMAARLLATFEDFYLAALVRKGEYYLCRINADIDPRQEIIIISGEDLSARVGNLPIGIIGRVPEGRHVMIENPIDPKYLQISGGDIARIGAKRITTGQYGNPADLEPMYIAPSQAEQKFGRS
jgi:tRNA threonylcarbamoyl adenosine modification protein YeaZ